MAATSFKQRKTPGVYVTEFDAFPPSVVGVETAVPAFIGYTAKAEVSGKPMFLKPVKIGSLADYEAIFGGAFEPKYDVAAVSAPVGADDYDFKVCTATGTNGECTAWDYYAVTQTSDSNFYLYNSLRMFFDNGGGTCYIVSVGDYTAGGTQPDGVSVTLADLQNGLTAIADQMGPTMLVVPDGVLIDSIVNFGTLATDMLSQCAELQDRVAILDVWGTQDLNQSSTTFQAELDALIEAFQVAVGDNFLNYGMAYFPFLNTSVVRAEEIDYTNFSDTGLATMTTLLTAQAAELYSGAKKVQVDGYIADMSDPDKDVQTTNQNLVNALPLMKQVENIIAFKSGLLPPSGAMAGIFTLIDQTRGVWNAPANTSLVSVISPTVKLNDKQQGDLNLPLNGKAVDVLRQFTGRGTVVWGARTLDGNSADWRYIQVRRTLVYVEQSIKNALNPFVFAANDGNTWVTVISMVSNFLQGLWSRGGLMGATPAEAYSVECGIGSTMTAQDVLDGYMIVQVTLQMIRPAEFIELTFKQKMEGLAG